MAELQLEHLLAGYPRHTVLKDISLRLASGCLTALLGPNGAGKTTLLRALAGIVPVSGGRSLWRTGEGVIDLTLLRPKARARYVSYVPQLTDNAVPLTVQEALDIVVGAARPPTSTERISQTLALFDLAAVADQRCDTLSGGMWRRVLLAQGLVQTTPILLLDEPVSFLDPPARHELLDLLRRIAFEQDLCILCVLHDPRLALQYADTAVAIRAGQVVAAGPVAQVISPVLMEETYASGSGWWTKETVHA